MSIKHIWQLSDELKQSLMGNSYSLQFREKLDGSGFWLVARAGRLFTKRVSSTTLYPLDPREGEPTWGDAIWEQTFKSAHLYLVALMKDFSFQPDEDFEIHFEILSSRTPNALEYLTYNSGVNVLVFLWTKEYNFWVRSFIEYSVNIPNPINSISTGSASVVNVPFVQNVLSDDLTLTQRVVEDKWSFILNTASFISSVTWYMLKSEFGSHFDEVVNAYSSHVKGLTSNLAWPESFEQHAIISVPVEGIIIEAKNVIGFGSDEFNCKVVDADWFLGLTRHNYSFRKKLFKTPHKRSDSVSDIHYRSLAGGASKGDCDRLAVDSLLTIYQEYLKTRHSFTDAVHDRNKEAVFTSLKSYGW